MNSGTLTEASERGTDGEVSKEPSGIENLAERDWPPVTLQDLPPPPPLRNIDRAKGSIVPLRVFGFAVPWSDLAVLAQNRGYNDGKHQFGGSARAWNDVQNHAKPWCDRYSIVKDGRMTAMCLVLATNRTEEDMTKMKDIETIEAVRKVVGIGRMPEWYKTTG